jgi:hypothetical protein
VCRSLLFSNEGNVGQETLLAELRVCKDVEHIGSTFGRTIDIGISSEFAGQFHINITIDIDICLRPVGDKNVKNLE